jgi:hypothetical protein
MGDLEDVKRLLGEVLTIEKYGVWSDSEGITIHEETIQKITDALAKLENMKEHPDPEYYEADGLHIPHPTPGRPGVPVEKPTSAPGHIDRMGTLTPVETPHPPPEPIEAECEIACEQRDVWPYCQNCPIKESEAFECGKCGQRYDIETGQKIQCPDCGHTHLADGE